MKALQFIAAIPRFAERHRLEQVSEVSELCCYGSRFWASDQVPIMDVGESGRILGVVFSNSSDACLQYLPVDAPQNMGSTAMATWLTRRCWGGYAALLANPASGSFDILVDPSGLLPVYRMETASHVLVATHVELFSAATGTAVQISWDDLHRYLYRPELREHKTCLANVTELPRGKLLPLCERGSPGIQIWQPDDFMPGSFIPTFEDAAAGLRQLAKTTIGSWAKAFGSVAVAASGGVDSSFIAAALKQGGSDFSCITLATADPSGDERSFVEMLGAHLGVQVISAIYDPLMIDPLSAVSAGLARPTRKPFMAALDAALLDAGHRCGSHIIFDGNGGDNIFCFLHSAAPIVDRLRSEGLGRATLATFLDMCRITGCDISSMARATMKRARRSARQNGWGGDASLLRRLPPDADHLDPLSPWHGCEVGQHVGKHDHLALIMQAQQHIHGLAADGLPRFSPLMSQPLVEFCLTIPTWIWCAGGINRALARAAFATALPSDIVRRTSKAGPDSFILRCFDEHRHVISALLMDGQLASRDIVDRSAVERALQADAFSGSSLIYRLLDLAEAENWVHSWQR